MMEPIGGRGVHVYARLRPLLRHERDRGDRSVAVVRGKSLTMLDPIALDAGGGDEESLGRWSRRFAFDACFASSEEESAESQQQLYTQLGEPLLDNAVRGYNGCILAYGQTGSGKSFSMFGPEPQAPPRSGPWAQAGLIPRFCDALFDRITHLPGAPRCSVEVSFMEIHNERIHDLLHPSRRKALRVREHPSSGPYAEGLRQERTSSPEQVRALLERGLRHRTVAATRTNMASSRSHAVVTVTLRQVTGSSERTSKVSLADLAGSERLRRSLSSGVRRRETGNINKSLATLGEVIEALSTSGDAKARPRHIPYRNSVLTWLLREALGGNTVTTMLGTVSPSELHYDESFSTLKYMERAKRIVTHATVNEETREMLVSELREEVSKLRAELEATNSVPQEELVQEVEQLRAALAEKERQVEQEGGAAPGADAPTPARSAPQLGASARYGCAPPPWGGGGRQGPGAKGSAALARRDNALAEVRDGSEPYLVPLEMRHPRPGPAGEWTWDAGEEEATLTLQQGDTLLGSGPECDIRVPMRGVVDRHVVLGRDGRRVWLTPEDGAPVHVNGAVVATGCCTTVTHGARILLGSRCGFRLHNPVEAEAIHVELARQGLELEEEELDLAFALSEVLGGGTAGQGHQEAEGASAEPAPEAADVWQSWRDAVVEEMQALLDCIPVQPSVEACAQEVQTAVQWMQGEWPALPVVEQTGVAVGLSRERRRELEAEIARLEREKGDLRMQASLARAEQMRTREAVDFQRDSQGRVEAALSRAADAEAEAARLRLELDAARQALEEQGGRGGEGVQGSGSERSPADEGATPAPETAGPELSQGGEVAAARESENEEAAQLRAALRQKDEEMARALREQEDELSAMRESLSEKKEAVVRGMEERDSELSAARAALRAKEEELAEARTQLEREGQRRREEEGWKEELAAKEHEVEALRDSLQDQEEMARQVQQQERELSELRAGVEGSEEELLRLRRELGEREEELVKQRREADEELSEMRASLEASEGALAHVNDLLIKKEELELQLMQEEGGEATDVVARHPVTHLRGDTSSRGGLLARILLERGDESLVKEWEGQELSSLRETLSAREEELEQMKQAEAGETKQLRETLSAREEELEQMKQAEADETKQLRETLSAREEELEQLKQAVAGETKQLRETLSAREEELEQVRESFMDREGETGEEAEQLRATLAAREEELDRLGEEVLAREEELEQVREVLVDREGEMGEELEQLRAEVAAKDEQIARFRGSDVDNPCDAGAGHSSPLPGEADSGEGTAEGAGGDLQERGESQALARLDERLSSLSHSLAHGSVDEREGEAESAGAAAAPGGRAQSQQKLVEDLKGAVREERRLLVTRAAELKQSLTKAGKRLREKDAHIRRLADRVQELERASARG